MGHASPYFLLCFVLILARATFLSIQQVCENEMCYEQLEVITAVPLNAQSEWELHELVPAGVVLGDEEVKWEVSNSMSLTFTGVDNRYEFPLQFEHSVANAYIEHQITSLPQCPGGSYCCLDNNFNRNMFTLRYNSTVYNLLSLQPPTKQGHIRVNVIKDGIPIGNITVSETQRTASAFNISVHYISISNTEFLYTMSEPFYVSVRRGVTQDYFAFLVPKINVCPYTNCIGVTASEWRAAIQSPAPCTQWYFESLLAVDGPYINNDQFALMRQLLVSQSLLSQCTLVPAHTNTDTLSGSPLKISFTCPSAGLPTIRLTMPSSRFGVQRLRASLLISGFGCESENVYFIDIINDAKVAGSFQIVNEYCLDEFGTRITLFESQQLYINPMSTLRVMLPRRDTDTQITSCTFGLYHQNRLERLLNVDMRRYICGYSAECEYPKRKVLIDYGVFICEDICPTKDMQYSVVALTCVPVNCSLVYGPEKSFWNATTQLCEPPPQALLPLPPPNAGEVYDPLECGPNGQLVDNSCVCNEGWTTRIDIEPIQYCNEQETSMPFLISVVSNNTKAIVLGISIPLIIVVLAIIIGIKVKRYRNKRRRRLQVDYNNEVELEQRNENEVEYSSSSGYESDEHTHEKLGANNDCTVDIGEISEVVDYDDLIAQDFANAVADGNEERYVQCFPSEEPTSFADNSTQHTATASTEINEHDDATYSASHPNLDNQEDGDDNVPPCEPTERFAPSFETQQ